MFIIGNFITSLARVVNMAFDAYIVIVIVRVALSWVRVDNYHPAVRFLYQVTEPVLGRIRRVLPVMGGIDLSPMLLILALVFLQSYIVQTLHRIGTALQ